MIKKKNKSYEKEGVPWSGGRPPTAVSKDLEPDELRMPGSIRLKRKAVKTKSGVMKRNRLETFVVEYLKSGGNATEAAMRTGNYSNRLSASAAGHQMLKKAKLMGRIYMEEKGYTYGKMLEVAMQKMEQSRGTDWWDRLMKIADYDDFTPGGEKNSGQVVNIIQANKEFLEQYVDGEVLEETEKLIDDES